jgi:hypothetical protein
MDLATAADFWHDVNLIADRYIGRPSTEHVAIMLKAEIESLVRDFYSQGGKLFDNSGKAMESESDVSVLVSRSEHSVGISVIRAFNPGVGLK